VNHKQNTYDMLVAGTPIKGELAKNKNLSAVPRFRQGTGAKWSTGRTFTSK